MPRVKGSGKGATQGVSIRFDPQTHEFLKEAAYKNGTSLAEYLRLTVMRGVMAESVEKLTERITEAAQGGFGQVAGRLNERELMALFLSEEILTDIAAQRDEEALEAYKARARKRVATELATRQHE